MPADDRSVLKRGWMVMTLAACLAFGAPGLSLRLLPVLGGETSENRTEWEHNDHSVLCASNTRRVPVRDHSLGFASPAKARVNATAHGHHALCSRPFPTLSSDSWSVPLRC
jgi:hypothetical protein